MDCGEMKWFVLAGFLILARHAEGGVLKCSRGLQDTSCTTQEGEKAPSVQTSENDKEKEVATTEAECLAGSEWNSNCHNCRCSESGIAECLKQDICDKGIFAEPLKCKPHTTFTRDCNTCVCLENGFGLCTLETCRRSSIPKKSELLPGKECAPGSSWKSQCNSCRCSDDGYSFCTKMECLEKATEPILRCAPNTMWTKECNTCWCRTDGVVTCSRMECETGTVPKKSELLPGKECSPGSSWKSRCNRCECSEDGYSSCTKMACLQLSTEPILRCAPNTMWTKECNTCWCTTDGGVMCTRMECETGTVPKKSELLPGKECSPGSSWKSQCNSCGCSDDGYSFCTEMACPEQATEPILRCAPNTMWTKDCNTCWCTDGTVTCTRVECETGSDSESIQRSETKEKPQPKTLADNLVTTHSIFKRSVCKPNNEFQAECNSCKCDPTGLSYTCTHNECLEGDMNDQVEVFMEPEGVDHIERHSVCKPRDTFHVSCNICHCNLYGTDYTCTNKPCPLPADVELFHELRIIKSSIDTKQKVCVANRMFIKDCNTCWCNDDGTSFFCTRKVCVPMSPDEGDGEDTETEDKLNIIKKKCRPDEVFEIDCNMCRCNPDGKSFSCTRRACTEQPENKNLTQSRYVRAIQEATKTCQPGMEFRLDCNKCLCDNEGKNFSCTRIDCNALNNHNSESRKKREVSEQVTAKCVPGSVFDQGCNVCRCTEDGHHATCAMKRCRQENEVDIHVPEQDPGFRCNPGEQFTRDCNDCTCSADGKSVFCTLRLCDEDLTPAI